MRTNVLSGDVTWGLGEGMLMRVDSSQMRVYSLTLADWTTPPECVLTHA